MKRRIKWIPRPAAGLLTAGLSMLLLSGCQLISSSPAALLKAPAMSSSLYQLKEAVTHYLPPGAVLNTPLKLPDNSAAGPIYQVDLNGDNQKEAVAFYRLQKNEFELGALILEQVDEEWRKVTDIHELGREIDRVDFVDVTGDGAPEMLVGWSAGEAVNLNKELFVYSMKGSVVSQMEKIPYTEIAIGDLTGDGVPEVAALLLDRDKLDASASLYSFKNGEKKLMQKLPMDGGVNGYYQVVIGKATDSQNGIFVDTGLGANTSYTSLLVWNNGKLKDVFSAKDEQGNVQTFKEYKGRSQDVNGDGIMEIELLKIPPFIENSNPTDMPWIHQWYQWDGANGLKWVHENYYDNNVTYRFDFPESWRGKITLERSKSDRADGYTTFYYLSANRKEKAELLTIRYYPTEQWENMKNELQKKEIDFVELDTSYGRKTVAFLPEKPTNLSVKSLQEYNQMKLGLKDIQERLKPVYY
ncbi:MULTISPECIES: hypothetical protein [Paenibacillus]|uniref:hypothetical protein n=1 Tax=Paenibacillus TaxID=44249 RepID=UPI00020D66EE|nr:MULTISPECIES: hypothetical protein [Paenibacillus]EGL16554.1 FG-GAP repeat protein [Paenibacillus sp. HGF7]EPD90241.1 hypothetical protein HMPREF1207_01027 [Paenibacillus sp. HGH0039]MBV6712632.1 hypothetical protein [Paenibacillus chitinolyticus]